MIINQLIEEVTEVTKKATLIRANVNQIVQTNLLKVGAVARLSSLSNLLMMEQRELESRLFEISQNWEKFKE
ncbi:MAG: hypothetical protein WC476_01580 [Phycisphaerae bacterium]|jgi:DNA-binding transcriptional regulator PaaX